MHPSPALGNSGLWADQAQALHTNPSRPATNHRSRAPGGHSPLQLEPEAKPTPVQTNPRPNQTQSKPNPAPNPSPSDHNFHWQKPAT